ncbi:hypothetical protein HN51_047922 [Arachis hypogaea]
MGKGTGSFGKRRNKTHTLCVKCGHRSFHLQKSRCSVCASPTAQRPTGTSRMRYLCHVPRRFQSCFREGTEAAPRKNGAAASRETVRGNHYHLGQALLEETKAALQPADRLVIHVLDDSTEPVINVLLLLI